MSQNNILFDLPKNRSNVIKVIGVGGGGSNAVNYMYKQGFNGVDFVVCNTDAQALHSSPVPNKIQLGVSLTEGLGAGARPEIGGEAAEESLKELEAMFANTKMLFLTAGMGGGTGTGAAPVIARLAAKMGILTVGIVTMPFSFEGDIRMKQAKAGMESLREYVDSMIVINNNKLRDVYGNLGLKSGFAKADEVLAIAAKGISEVITTHYGMNIDLHDAKTVLENSGTAIMGSAEASGDNRALEAVAGALDSPLLNDNSITGAKQVLLLIISGEDEITIDEMSEISEYIQSQSGNRSNIIMGVGEEEDLGSSIKVTVIATGFNSDQQAQIIENTRPTNVYTLTAKNTPTPEAVIRKETVETVVKEVENKAPKTKKIVYDLYDKEEVVEDIISEKNNIMDVSDDDIVIQDVSPSQTAIEFDFEISEPTEEVKEEENNDKLYFNLGDESETDIEEEEISNFVSHNTNEGIVEQVSEVVGKDEAMFSQEYIKHDLKDFQELENCINEAKPVPEIKQEIDLVEEIQDEEIEPEMQIHIVKRDVEEFDQSIDCNKEEKEIIEYQDPLNIPISKKEQIGKDRRERLKRFNHSFKTRSVNPSTIDDLEKQPAYKRAGIDVTSSDHRVSGSRYSLGNDNSDIQIRKNNSFLHDNVD